MSGQWTPGPWPKFPRQWRIHPGVLLSDGNSGTPGGDEIDRANAALIAAAPDLAEALSTAMIALEATRNGGDFPDFEKWEVDARAALARARGDQP